MREFIMNYFGFERALCLLILLSRLGDIGSTYLITPKLKLEANPIARKLGWPFAVLTLLVCLIPYYSTALGVVALVPSLLVSASNTGKIWFIRAYGENEYYVLLHRLARASKLSHALAGTLVSALFIALVGLALMFLSPDPTKDWGYWFAIGLLAYAFVVAFYGCLSLVRLFKIARREEGKPIPPTDAEQKRADEQ